MDHYENRQVILKKRPKNIPEAEDFKIIKTVLPKISTGKINYSKYFFVCRARQ